MNPVFGPLVSPVSGDFSREGHVTYVKFNAGMTTPPHTHTHDYVGIVLTGVSMHWEPGKPETKKKLSTGAHWFVPANTTHVSECLPGVECVMAIYQQDAMDFLPRNLSLATGQITSGPDGQAVSLLSSREARQCRWRSCRAPGSDQA